MGPRNDSIGGEVGCTGCHTPDLRIDRDRRMADVETRFDSHSGIFNRLSETATTLFDVEGHRRNGCRGKYPVSCISPRTSPRDMHDPGQSSPVDPGMS